MKANLDQLKALKADSEGIEEILERNREMFERDYQKYVEFMVRKAN